MERRTFLAGAAAALAAGSAGCTALGDDRLRFEAGRAYVPEGTVEDAGYELRDTGEAEFERTVEVGDRSRTVEAVGRYAVYEKPLDGGVPGATVSALSVPELEVLGASVNPVAHLSPEEVAERAEDRYGQIRDLEVVEEASITVLGTETTRTRFEGDLDVEGRTVEVDLHVTDAVESGDDLVLGVGGHPSRIDEAESVETMLTAIEHEPA